jgi:thiosulfate dehydrogenase [quinone] large subunit
MRITSRPFGLATAIGRIAIGRIAIGIIYLWAGLEKISVGDGKGGPFSAVGFLKFGTNGTLGWPFVSGTPADGTVFNPTHDFWVNLAGSGMMPLINLLVVVGEVGIGLALILGLATRFASAMGTLMMIFFFFAAWDYAFGIVNQHLTYAVVTFGLGVIGAGNYFGLDGMIANNFPSAVRRLLLSGNPEEPTTVAA